jgi:hypothetical protein
MQATKRQCLPLLTQTSFMWLNMLIPSCDGPLVANVVHALEVTMADAAEKRKCLAALLRMDAVAGLSAALQDALQSNDDTAIDPGATISPINHLKVALPRPARPPAANFCRY